MRRLIGVGLAVALSACGDAAPPVEASQEQQPSWTTHETADERGEPFRVTAPSPVAPRVISLPSGAWVRDEPGSCVEREEWFVITRGGELDHVLANRNACGAPSLARHVGRWSTDQQVAHLRWSNREETVRRDATFWASDSALQLGAYVPVDGGWHREDSVAREVGSHTMTRGVTVGLRVDGLKLEDGAACRMSATVNVEVDGRSAAETFEFDCVVTAREDGFLIVADRMSEEGGWYGHLQRRDVWARHGTALGNVLYEGFQPVLFTVDGQALWHERADSVYRFTSDEPPLTTEDLEE